MQNYSYIQKFLHDFVLSKKFINKSLFEIEKIIYLKNLEIKDSSFDFLSWWSAKEGAEKPKRTKNRQIDSFFIEMILLETMSIALI